MKVLHKSKRSAPPHPQVAELISKLLATPNDDLADVLQAIDAWKWPRSDLNAWIKVLNKFDVILEDAIRDYDVDNLQLSVFTPLTKRTICEILRFERLLLENSTNRKMFSSYDRLNSLFMTSDMDVLVLTLNLLLRPSQQYSAQPNVLSALNISTPRLQSLAKKWPALRDYNIRLVDLVSSSGSEIVAALPAEAREVHFTFYHTPSSQPTEKMDVDQAGPSLPKPLPSGAVHIYVDEQTLESKPAIDILADLVERYSLPDSEKLELLCRIRDAQALLPGRDAERQQLVTVRLLALAIFGHTHTETQANTLLFLYEPDLIGHVAELLHIDCDFPVTTRTASISALDAMARYRGRVTEVLASVNAGVNHGLLMGLLRKTVSDISEPSCTLPHSFVEALIGFITYIATQSAGGAMIVGAGLVPLLIQLIENKLPARLLVVSKTLQLVDNVVYNFPNAFQLFCAAKGVDSMVTRIQDEVDLDIAEFGDLQKSKDIYGSFGHIPVPRAALLKHALRSMHRMMQSSGTAEGLRGLIDSTLLKSVKKIIEYRGLFGPSVLPIAINIMATFVHNEPTSLSIIQEAGLPEVFYLAIDTGLEPSIEVIQSMVNAIGALCLNQTGQEQLESRPSIIPGIFSIFTSEKHTKVLLDKENAVLIGATMDELIRHHPTIKEAVFDSIKATLSKIEDLGRASDIPTNIKGWYQLAPISSLGEQELSSMEGIEAPLDDVLDPASRDGHSEDDPLPRSHDNRIVSFIDVTCRFLEGLFQHIPHCRDFVTSSDGLQRIGNITSLPCLPYDFTNGPASDSLVQILRTMTEVQPKETVSHVLSIVKQSIDDTRPYWSSLGEPSKLLALAEFTGQDERVANQMFRGLVTLNIRSTLLSDIFSNVSYSHGRVTTLLLDILLGSSSGGVVPELGTLHRLGIWEDIALKAGLAYKGLDMPHSTPRTPFLPPNDLPPSDSSHQRSDSRPIPSAENTTQQGHELVKEKESVREQNVRALKHLAHALPASLSPFFLAIIKMFTTRRTPDASQRKQIMLSAKIIADIVLQHVTHVDIPDETLAQTYWSGILGAVGIFIIDERTTSQTVYTVLLSALYEAGGLDAIANICQQFIQTIRKLQGVQEADRSEKDKSTLDVAFGGLQVALHLLHSCISAQPILEASQTTLLTQKNEQEADFFEPHNFLVKTRLAVMPLARDIWQSDWLHCSPISLIRTVILIVLEISNGEQEEMPPELPTGPISGTLPIVTTRQAPAPPDEGRISQLMEMGFPRGLVVRALHRAGNNVTAATEFLLAQPWPLADVPETEPISNQQPPPETNGETTQGGSSDVDMEPDESPQEPSTVDSVKPAAEWKKELDDARESLNSNIDRLALRLVDEHSSLIFDLHKFFVRPSPQHQKTAVQGLINDVADFSPAAYDAKEQPLANRCRLLALVLSEIPGALDSAQRVSLMDHMLALLLSSQISRQDNPSLPKWLATHLLVVEALLVLFDEPRSISIPTDGQPEDVSNIAVGPPYSDARNILFDFCFRILVIPTLPSDELLSVLRLFVLLTRDYEKARDFVKRDGVTALFQRLRVGDLSGASCSSYVTTILRHTLESQSTVQHIMKHGVRRYLAGPRIRIVDISSFVRSCSAMALRDPSTFLDVVKSNCQLTSPSSPFQITLKPLDTPESSNVAKGEEEQMSVDAPHPVEEPHNAEFVEHVLHFLLAELITSVKAYNSGGDKTDNSIPGDDHKSAADAPSDPDSLRSPASLRYCCFLMQCLIELMFSYDSCKVAFLTYSPRKRLQTPTKDTSKYRTAALSFLLSELISFQTLNPPNDDKTKGAVALCNWAITLIVALCVDTSPSLDGKEGSHELQSVRKFVLESVNRAIKDLPPTDSIDERYGRLLALADLCFRLLTVQVNNQPRKTEDMPTQIVKIMVEKNFVTTLTSALADVDLNYPNVRNLVASILKPLELLSKFAIKMSRSSAKKDTFVSKVGETEVYPSDSEEESEEEDREETPDLYRNSALGMYTGEMEEVHYSQEEEMDEEDEMDVDDAEMDFAEDTGSEHTSPSEGDDDEDDSHPLDDLPHTTSTWDENGDDDEEDEEEDEEDEDEDEDMITGAVVHNDDDDAEQEDEDSDEEEGNPDMIWQDILPDEAQPADEDPDAAAVENLAATLEINRDDEGEEPDAASEDEEYNGNNIGDLAIVDSSGLMHDIFGSIQGAARLGGLLVSRRHRANEENPPIFGRSRSAGATESVTHPLLIDSEPSTSRHPLQGRSARTTPRTTVNNENADVLHVIEDLVGGATSRIFQHITTRGTRATIRLDPATFPSPDRGLLQNRGNNQVLSAHLSIDRHPVSRAASSRLDQGLSFEPMVTLQRWAEESKMLNRDFVSERASKLTNFVIAVLLPAAKAAKAKLDEARAKQEEEERLKAEEAERAKLEAEAAAAKEAVEAQAVTSEQTPQVSSAEDAHPIDEGPSTTATVADTEMTDATSGPRVEPSREESSTEEGPSTHQAPRVTVLIHGNVVDITDTGIDPTFLEALPDDMREEVLNQHVRDQRVASIQRPPDSQISSEFLDALPPEIRAEIIQQERMEQSRRRVEEAGNANQPATASDIDPASFIASLDPHLREVVLLDQDEGFIQSLPPHMLAEAAGYRENILRRRLPRGSQPDTQARPPTSRTSASQLKPPVQHEALQLLDKGRIAVLVRLLFFPQVLKKNLLYKVLVNLCENSRTRTELFNLILSILQDGTGDLAVVDKSFAQMTFRNTGSKPTTPSKGKSKASSENVVALSHPHPQVEAVPDLIAQRCLEALNFIISANETSSLFFLTEQEVPSALRKVPSKKGKGKEKQLPQTYYPIVLLLGMLDRQYLLKMPTIMESIVGLLAAITRPLSALKQAKGKVSEGLSDENIPAAETSAAQSGLEAPVQPTSESTQMQPTEIPKQEPAAESSEDNALLSKPPVIPQGVLRLIVNILTTGECSGRTFQQSLTLIHHLSFVPDARDTIAFELRSKAQEFGQILYNDLIELADVLRSTPEEAVSGAFAAKFSPASSVQAKFLRVLKTIDYMYAPKHSTTQETSEDAEKVQGIYESFQFSALWRQLGDCLSFIEEAQDTEQLATILLPLIESLMVVCKYVGVNASNRSLLVSASPRSPSTPKETMEDLFVSFTDAHRKVLNLMVRNNPSLMSGSFSLLVHNPRVLDFDNKRNYFNQQLHKRPHSREHYGTLQLNVRRARLFEDSFQALQRKTGDQIKYGKLNVRFYDEEGVDAGGVTREWFQILARQMFDPNNALFQPCAADRLTYQPNKNSWVNPEHLSFFKFVGRAIGKAIYDGRLLDAYFARSLYRQILNKPVDYRDVEWVDPEYYNSLCWILENDPTVLDTTFSVEADEFGVNRIIPLKEGGESITVTQENKREFVQLSAQYRLYSSIKDQINSLLEGFYEIIPRDLVTIFNEQELELLISGTPDIDVDEWRAATEYHGYSSSDPAIVWWWRALKSFNRDERAKVLSFATGTSKVPLGGFVDLQGVQGTQRFSIHKAYGETDRLPQAHTCFNQIDLPQYSSYENLRRYLLLAINEGGEGFGFA